MTSSMKVWVEEVEDAKDEMNDEEEGEEGEVMMLLMYFDHCHSEHTHCDRIQDWKAEKELDLKFR